MNTEGVISVPTSRPPFRQHFAPIHPFFRRLDDESIRYSGVRFYLAELKCKSAA